MSIRLLPCAGLLAFTAGFAASTNADVESYAAGYQFNHRQTGSQVDLYACSFFWGVNSQPGDATTASVVSALGNAYEGIEVVPGIFQGGSLFTDPAEMFTEFPLGTYSLLVDGGSLGYQDGDVELPDPIHFPDTVPMFDPSQVAEYEAIDSSNDYTFRINSFTSSGNENITYLVIDSFPSTARVYLGFPGAGDTSHTVPAGTMRLNRRFTATLYFLGQQRTDNAGFVDAPGTSLAWYSTSIQLRTGDCPPDYNGDAFVDFFDYLDFVEGFESGDPDADFNGDGFMDFFDYTDFVFGFENGC